MVKHKSNDKKKGNYDVCVYETRYHNFLLLFKNSKSTRESIAEGKKKQLKCPVTCFKVFFLLFNNYCPWRFARGLWLFVQKVGKKLFCFSIYKKVLLLLVTIFAAKEKRDIHTHGQ